MNGESFTQGTQLETSVLGTRRRLLPYPSLVAVLTSLLDQIDENWPNVPPRAFGTDRALRCCFRLLDIVDYFTERDDDGLGTALLVALSKRIHHEANANTFKYYNDDRLDLSRDALMGLKALSKHPPLRRETGEQGDARGNLLDGIIETLHAFIPAMPSQMEVENEYKDLPRCTRHAQIDLELGQFAQQIIEATSQSREESSVEVDLRWARRCRAYQHWARVRDLLPEVLGLSTASNAP